MYLGRAAFSTRDSGRCSHSAPGWRASCILGVFWLTKAEHPSAGVLTYMRLILLLVAVMLGGAACRRTTQSDVRGGVHAAGRSVHGPPCLHRPHS